MGKGLEETVDILQELHREVDGIAWAPYLKQYPTGEIARSDMPCVMTIPQTGVWGVRQLGLGCVADDRVYRVVVITADTGTGIETEYFSEPCRLIDEFGRLYNSKSIATAGGGDLTIRLDGELPLDTGLDDEIVHADTRYYGFQFTIRIWRKL